MDAPSSQLAPAALKSAWLPRDLWSVIVVHLPVLSLKNFALVSRFLRETINSEAHWRARIELRGLMALFLAHRSRRFFTNHQTGVRSWRDYYVAFHVAEIMPYDKPPKPFLSDELCTADKVITPRVSRQDLDRFPPVEDGEPFGPFSMSQTPRSKKKKDYGRFEVGSWWLHDGRFKHYSRYREKKIQSHDVWTSDSFREFKSEFIIRSVECPFDFSWLDWAWYLLDCIDMALQVRPATTLSATPREYHYITTMAFRHPRTITVKYGARSLCLLLC